MLKQLKIENFRCFKSFELNHLGRVNLLVGKNNSGKTSVLEAIKLLSSGFDQSIIFKIMYFRGGYSLNHNVCNIESLFYGHEFDLGTQLKISCMHNESIRSIKALVTDTKIIEDNLI